MEIYVAGIVYGSMVDGKGLRTTIFLSGCSVGCDECHNKKYWDKKKGKLFTIKELVKAILPKTPQKKVTISGGEPMEQEDALIQLLKELKNYNFDIGLYTSYDLDDISKEIIQYLNFIKTGKFDKNKKVSGKFFGSSNQRIDYF